MIRTANKVALYARFSSDNQRTESIDAQLRAMKAYCQQRNFIIVNTYVDEAKSATTDRRPAFQQMIADSKEHNFNILLVHKLDRFARNRYDSAVYKRELKKNGVTVFSVLENLDDSPESIMMESVLEGMSEYYSQNLAREVMKGMRETALQGKHTGGKPPLGYDVDPVTRKLVINEREAETVRLIYEMYSRGEGYSLILATLYDEGRKTKKGKDFQKNSLYSILTNPKYQGNYVFNRSAAKDNSGHRNTHKHKAAEETITIEGGCPQIVDTDTYNKVQERIKNNKHTGGRKNAKTNYLLSGKVRCKECGRAMVGNTRYSGRSKLFYSTYRCPSKRHACTNKEVNRICLEEHTIALLEEHIFNATAMRKIIRNINRELSSNATAEEQKKEALQKELEEVETALQNIADAVGAGLLSDVLINRLAELEEKKASIEEVLRQECLVGQPLTIDQQVILAQYAELRKAPMSPDFKEFIQYFIAGIEVGRYVVTITIRTGLGTCPALDTIIPVRRQVLYQRKERPA